MRNVTITLPEEVLNAVRLLAAEQQLSVNKYLGNLIEESTHVRDPGWAERHAELHRQIPARTSEGRWNRQELNEERINRVR